MPAGGLVIGGLAAAASTGIGAAEASEAANKSQSAMEAAVAQYLSVTVPDPAKQQLLLRQYKLTGRMDPRLAQAFQQAKTEMGKITTDASLDGSQMAALRSLENTAQNGGHTLAQDSYLNKVQQQVNAENRGRQGAIEEKYAARGMGQPSGLMLSAEMQNNQNMTQKENDASMEAANQAQQNALKSLMGAGELATKVKGQQFDQKAAVAQAQDSINAFNAKMNQGVEMANVAAQNDAQAYNVKEQQAIADKNVSTENYQQEYNQKLQQQQFDNQMRKASGVANAYGGQATNANLIGQQQANMWGNIGQGALKAGVGAGQVYGARNNSDDSAFDDELMEW
jgi:hypothetical protein